MTPPHQAEDFPRDEGEGRSAPASDEPPVAERIGEEWGRVSGTRPDERTVTRQCESHVERSAQDGTGQPDQPAKGDEPSWFDMYLVPLVRELFFDPDIDAMAALYSCIAAHELPGPPLWAMAIAPPGSAKTTLLEPLVSALPRVRLVDKVTPNTWLSGQITKNSDGPASLLHRIGDDGWVLMPDFSTVLSMKMDDRTSVFSDLRRIYDGEISKEVGTSEGRVEWKGRITLVVAVTPQIDSMYGAMQALGERFVRIRWKRPGGECDGVQAALSAMQQDHAYMKAALADAVRLVFKNLSVSTVSMPEHCNGRWRLLPISSSTPELTSSGTAKSVFGPRQSRRPPLDSRSNSRNLPAASPACRTVVLCSTPICASSDGWRPIPFRLFASSCCAGRWASAALTGCRSQPITINGKISRC